MLLTETHIALFIGIDWLYYGAIFFFLFIHFFCPIAYKIYYF